MVANLPLYRVLVGLGAGEESAQQASEFDASGLATKADLEQLRLATKADFEQLRLATKADLEQMRLVTKADLEQIRLATKADLEQARADTRTEIASLRADTERGFEHLLVEIHKLEARLAWGGVSLLVAMTGIFAAIVKLF